jgi:ketosteroid isomerase-like protein
MSDNVTAADVFKHSLEAFLGKDMRAWADLCAEDVLVEFPFSPDNLPSKLEGRQAIFEYLQYYPTIIDIHEIDSVTVYETSQPPPSSPSGA